MKNFTKFKSLLVLGIVLITSINTAWATSGTITAASTTDLGKGNTPRYVVEQAGVGRLMRNSTGSSEWAASDGKLQTGSSKFALQTYNEISSIVINGYGTGGGRTFSSMRVGSTTGDYAAASATGSGTMSATESSQTITITPASNIAKNSYVEITLSGNIYIYSVELVYASATPRYKVTYKANGGTGSDVVFDYVSGTVAAMPNYCFSRDGYTFTGWNTESNGSGTTYQPNATFTLSANTTLHAQWSAYPGSSDHFCIDLYNHSASEYQNYFTQIGSTKEFRCDAALPNFNSGNNYWVGYNGYFYKDGGLGDNNKKSVNAELQYIPFYTDKRKTIGNQAQTLKGTYILWSNSTDDNLNVSYIPKNFGFCWGASGESWDQGDFLAFHPTENAHEWMTDMVSLTSTQISSWKYYVGVQKSNGDYVGFGFSDGSADLSAMDTYDRNGTGWQSVYVNSFSAGQYGAFRMWDNNYNSGVDDSNNDHHGGDNPKNLRCHFVPFYTLSYNANSGTGAPAITGVAQEGSSAQRTIKVSTTEPTRNGYSFQGWATSSANASAGAVAYAPGADITLSADVELWAVWKCVDPTIGTDLSEDQVDYYVGDAATALTVAATAAGGSVSYQWYSNDEKNTTTPTTLTTGASYTPSTAAAGTTYYYCVVTNSTAGCSTTTTSSFAKIVVSRKDPATQTFSAASTSICSGSDATFTLASSQVGATYYLTKANDGGSAIGDSKAGTGSALTFTATSATTGDYYCWTSQTTAFNAMKVSKSKVTISYKTATSVTVDDATLDDAVVDEEYTISGITGAGAGSLTYQWYSYSDDKGSDQTKIDGAESDTYAFTPAAAGNYYFKCEVTGTCGSVKSDLITVTATAAVTYSVTYKANGGTGDDVTNDPETTISSNSFTAPATKAFVGWNTEPDGTGTPYAVGDAVDDDLTLYAQWRYKVYYIYKGDSEESNDITTALASKYVVSKHTTTGTSYNASDYSDYALIVLSESLNGGDAKTSGHELKVIKGLNKPILNLKSYLYNKADNDHRWDWGTPNAGKKPKCIYVKNSTYANLTSHPIYSGLTPDGNDSIQILKTPKTTKPIQPVGEFASGCEGYTLALVPNNSSGSGTAIHEMTAAQRSSATGETITSKYLLISIQAGELSNLSDDGKTLIKNAADYLITGSQWVPQYKITHSAASNGSYTIQVGDASAVSTNTTSAAGTTITLAATPSSGYELDSWTVTGDVSSGSVTVTSNTFTMPAEAVTVSATFVLSCSAPTSPSISGTTSYTAGEDIELTASATGTSGSSTYTWYKGADWATASATSSIGSSATFSKASCVVADAGTYWCNISNGTGCDVQVSQAITVAKADLSVGPAAGTATSVTHNSATLPFTLESTAGVASVTLKVYNTSDVLVKTVSNVTKATSGSGSVTGLTASTTYYFTVTPIGDANHNDGAESTKSSTFTTSAAPTLSAMEANTLYKVEDMVPSTLELSSTEQYDAGLSANTHFEVIGDPSEEGDAAGTPGMKNESASFADQSFTARMYLKGASNTTGSGTTMVPTSRAIKFIIPSAGLLDIYAHRVDRIYLKKAGDSGETQLGSSTSTSGSKVTHLVTAGTYYIYAKGGSTCIYGMELTPCNTLTLDKNNSDDGSTDGANAYVLENATAFMDGFTAPTRSGYGVTGYYAESGCTTLVADAEGNLEASVTVNATEWTDEDGKWTKGSDATLYAGWGALYTVTFNTNGGSSVASITQASVGASITMPAAPTKSGYTFNGWQIGSTYAVGASYTPTANVTAYATWKTNCPGDDGDVTLAADGTNKLKTWTSGNFSAAFSTSNDEQKDYVKLSASETVAFSTSGTETITSVTITSSSSSSLSSPTTTTITVPSTSSDALFTASTSNNVVTVTAVGQRYIYTTTVYYTEVGTDCYYVTYNGNGATSGYVSDPEKYAEDADPTILANGYTKTGYTFRCWNTAADRSGDDYAPDATYTDIKDNVTLYAIWVKNENVGKYTFHYGNNSTDSWEEPVAFSQVGDTHKWNANFTIPDQTDYPNLFVGYEGYATAKSAVTTWFGNSAEDVSGKLIISDDSAADNYGVAFNPSGYGVTLSGSSQTLAFKSTATTDYPYATSSNYLWETDPVTLVAGDISGTFTVKLKTSDGYTTCSISEDESAATVDGRKITSTADMASGAKGRFQIWSNETSTDNFALRFVPMTNWTLKSGKWGGYYMSSGKWSLGREPNIDDEVIIYHDTDVDYQNNAQAKSIKIDKSEDSRKDIRLTITDWHSGLLVKDSITAKHVGDENFGPTNQYDLCLKTSILGNGCLIVGGVSETTAASYDFYASAYKVRYLYEGKYYTFYTNQYIGIPFASMDAYQMYGMNIYEYNDELDKWGTPESSTLKPWTAYDIISKYVEVGGMHYLDGTLILPGITGEGRKKVLTCGDRYNEDGTFDGDNQATPEANGDHMFANSWTAPIDISKLDGDDVSGGGDDLEQTIYIFNAGYINKYDPKKVLGDYAGQWSSYPFQASAHLDSAVISSMQAFLVTAKVAGAKLTLDYKKHVYDPAIDKGAINTLQTRAPKRTRSADDPVKLKIVVHSDSTIADKLYIFERADFSETLDNGWDGRKIMGTTNVPQIYAVCGNTNLAVAAIPDMEGTVVGFQKGSEYTTFRFTFEYNGTDTWYLHDTKTMTTTPISNTNTYQFYAEEDDAAARFVISRSPIYSPAIITNIDKVMDDSRAKKVIINDHIYIIRGGNMYSVDGAIVK